MTKNEKKKERTGQIEVLKLPYSKPQPYLESFSLKHLFDGGHLIQLVVAPRDSMHWNPVHAVHFVQNQSSPSFMINEKTIVSLTSFLFCLLR